MTDPTLPMLGGCRCGRVRFAITQAPLMTTICHCAGCQRMTGGAFSTTIVTPADGFSVTQGETVAGGLHGGPTKGDHRHCDWCKSWVFTRVDPALGFVNVRATMLDDPSGFVPFIETYTSEALPWARAGARHAYEKFPAMDEYPMLLAEFAGRQS